MDWQLKSDNFFPEERFPSGQREQTVNLSAKAFGGSNPPLSTRILKTFGFQNYQSKDSGSYWLIATGNFKKSAIF
jgi:hypothetical protein